MNSPLPVVCPPSFASGSPQPTFAGLALSELFAPHVADGGRHAVCRVCKALVTPSATARTFHMREFHRVDMSPEPSHSSTSSSPSHSSSNSPEHSPTRC